jgi:hypothetical protein
MSHDPVPPAERRALFLAGVRFQHVLLAIICAQRGPVGESTLLGDDRAGRYFFDDGNGERFLVVWDEDGLVALAFELIHLRPWDPFARAPSSLARLVREVTTWGEAVGTAALWMTGAGGAEIVGRARQSDLLDRLLSNPPECDFGATDGNRALAASITARSAAGATVLLPGEETLLLTSREDWDLIPTAENARLAAEMLRQVGIRWSGAEEAAERVGVEMRRRREEGDVDKGFALLQAVDRGDLAAVVDLIAAGANLDKPSLAGWLEGVPQDVTPLLLAIQTRHGEIAKHLISAGADVNCQQGGVTPLTEAARRGNSELCRLLLERGARTTVAWGGREQPVLAHLFDTQDRRGHADVVRVLLDAGATLPNEEARQALAEIARQLGALDLVPRLLGAEE